MERVWLNDVEAYAGGIAAVDAYLGATQEAESKDRPYGGAHVLEELVAGGTVELRATSHGTDCYPRRSITTELLLEDMNQAIMVNPRNSYQRYNAATNTTDRTLNTYMGGTLLTVRQRLLLRRRDSLPPAHKRPPRFPGHRERRPDLPCRCGGMIVGEGTQHSAGGGFGT